MSGSIKLVVCCAVLCAAVCGSAKGQDPLLGKRVFFKDSATAKIGTQVVDKYKLLSWPATVEDVNGKWLWLGRAWVKRSEVMLLDEAFDYSVEEVRRNPSSANAWLNRGTCWKERGEYDNAIKDFDEAIRLDPKYALAYNNRGNAKSRKQDYDGAIADFSEAIRLDPKDAVAYYNRGLAKNHKQDYDGAIKDYDEAIRLDPKDALAYNNRGNAKTAKQDHDGAIKDYDEAIRRDPKFASAYNNRGVAKYEKQDYDGAIKDYSEAIRLDPKFASAYHNRGVSQFLMRDADATESFQSVIDVEGWQGSRATYSVILGCLSGRLIQKPERAAQYLADAQGKLKEEWPYPIVRYLQEDLDETGLLALSTDNDKLTEAHCFVGLDLLAKGDPAAARTHLEWVRDHGNKTFVEYKIAIAELKRLDGKGEK